MLDLEAIRHKRRVQAQLPAPEMRRALRKSAGLSQEDVAQALGVNRESVSRWERGQRHPRGVFLDSYVALLQELAEVDE